SQQPQSQQQSQQQVLHPEQQPVQRPVSADWKEASTSGGNAPSAATPAQPTIDLSDFLGDLSAPQSASPLNNPSFFPFTNYFFSNNANQYNAMNYGSNNWPNASGTVPLSSYSTLNGATTSAPTTSQTQQPPSQQAVIDPALTTISTSSTSTHAHSYSPPNISPQSPPAQHSSSQYPYSHLPHSSNLSIPYSTSFQPNQQHQPQQQQHQPQFQGTLSPQALHAPSLGISPSSFYNSTPSLAQQAQAQANAEALQRQAEQHAQMRKDRFISSIKQHLSAKAFSGAGGVRGLVSLIAEYGIADVDAQTRLDIVTKVRDHAGNHYFRAWVENGTAMDIMREWLKAGAAAGDDSPLVETVMPLLHITDRLPFNGDTLIASKIGKIVRKIGKEIGIPAVKDMASNLERKWREKFVAVQTPQEQAMSVDEESQDGKPKKRKSSEPPSKAPPAKKVAVASASSSKPTVVKREVKAGSSATVKDSKSDSSFFSAPKPKPKLPSFKKSAGPPVKKEHDPNVAQPSAIDPFQIALKDMAKARKASPAAAPTPPSTSTPPQATAGDSKSGKKRKSVTWPPDGKLEQVKLIERAIYDDDPADGMHQMHNVRDLDRDEGAALHAHLFEELIDWFEPFPTEFPPEMEMRPRGEASVEKLTQEQRESTALGAMYLPQQIPDSPGEPAKEFRVNKPGPNKGKTFFLCSRPVGPGYDKGRSERLREEVDHQYRCNFFKWASELKKEALRASGNGSKE
ncbi:hypothetical protein EWM64_g3273, partial [Hericium alpestre]